MQDTALQQFSDKLNKNFYQTTCSYIPEGGIPHRSFSRIQAKLYVVGSDNMELVTGNKF
jgi:hypothetical protein